MVEKKTIELKSYQKWKWFNFSACLAVSFKGEINVNEQIENNDFFQHDFFVLIGELK